MMTIELPNSWHDISIEKFPLIYDIKILILLIEKLELFPF
jgi:hypothetical protein